MNTLRTALAAVARLGVRLGSPNSFRRRQRRVRFEALEPRLALDGAGSPQVELTLELTSADGSSLSSLAPGQGFVLHAYTRDLRSAAQGVFAAYLDVTWDGKAIATGPLQFDGRFYNGRSGSLSTAGLIDEGGAFGSGEKLGSAKYEVFRVPMRATEAGTIVFVAEPAELHPEHDVLVLGNNNAVSIDEIAFGSASIIVTGFGASNDRFDLAQNAGLTTLDVLANDVLDVTVGGTLTITSIGTGNQGGTIAISQNGTRLTYRPAANFLGDEQFSYTIGDGRGGVATALVTVHVEVSGNHAPVANDDFATAFADTDNVISVLANDNTAPDIGETLTIIAVSAPEQGGAASIQGGQIIYRPRDSFTLFDIFSYTVSDGRGGTATASVRVTLTQRTEFDPRVDLYVRFTRPDGSPLLGLTSGDDFVLHVFAMDISAFPRGVFSAYVDVLWDGSMAVVTGPIEYPGSYTSGQSGNVSSPGTIDEAGAFRSTTTEAGAGPQEVFRVPLRATATGPIVFRLDPADLSIVHDVLVYGRNDPVPLSAVRYISGSLIISDALARDDSFTVPPGNGSVTIDVLANDNGGPASLRIENVGLGDHGGTIQVHPGGTQLVYTPVSLQFTGTETFTYSIADGNGFLSTAVVRLQVMTSLPIPGITLDQGVLRIIGSTERDIVTVLSQRGRLLVSGTLGQKSIRQTFALERVKQLAVELGAGDDRFTVSRHVRAPLSISGGSGDDTIIAGGGVAVLVGGEGDDFLFGSSRRDVLIGGAGSDQLFGGTGSDLVVGGRTAFDNDSAALRRIQQEWTSSRRLYVRVANLRSGNGPILSPLGTKLRNNESVFNEGGVDALFGGSDQDWFVGVLNGIRKDRSRSEPLG